MVSSRDSESIANAARHSNGGSASNSTDPEPRSKTAYDLDLTDCRQELSRLQTALKELRRENLILNRELDRDDVPIHLQVFIEDQAKRLELMRTSLSWRVTAPLRMLARLLGAA